jgi:tRNA modification GTPase
MEAHDLDGIFRSLAAITGVPEKTIACQLTASGRGAIAVVRVQGARALEIANQVFRPIRPVPLTAHQSGRPRLGRVGANRGDEVVAVVLGRCGSTVELHCHGGTAAVESVFVALENAGASRRNPLELTSSTQSITIRTEAIRDLVNAPTARTAEILLDQAHGALTLEIERLVAQIAGGDSAAAAAGLATLIARAATGLRLLSGWRIAIVGRPNVGKSRLLNALAGYQRSIVDPTPGTTRDTVTLDTALRGWPVEIIDTAGVRPTSDLVENLGVARSRREIDLADLALLILDGSEPLTEQDHRLFEAILEPLVVINKSDLAPAWTTSELTTSSPAVVISAETGAGITELIGRIVGRLVPNAPPAGAGVPFRDLQVRGLERASRALATDDRESAMGELRDLVAREA